LTEFEQVQRQARRNARQPMTDPPSFSQGGNGGLNLPVPSVVVPQPCQNLPVPSSVVPQPPPPAPNPSTNIPNRAPEGAPTVLQDRSSAEGDGDSDDVPDLIQRQDSLDTDSEDELQEEEPSNSQLDREMRRLGSQVRDRRTNRVINQPPELRPGRTRLQSRASQSGLKFAGTNFYRRDYSINFEKDQWASYGRKANINQKVPREQLNNAFLQKLDWNFITDTLKSADYKAMDRILMADFDFESYTQEDMHPLALAAKANDADNPTWEETMNGPVRKGYMEAAKKEIETLVDMDAWDVVDREEWMNVLPSTWAFKCKRYPDGSIRKLKGRFCARGDRQVKDVDFFSTFAPVVSWTTVRLMLILSLILNLATTQVDYTSAFIHAPIDKDPNWDTLSLEEQARSGVYLEMTRGFREPGKVLKLKRSLYGLKQSPRNFFLHLKGKLEKVGFKSCTDIDPCLFVSDKVIALVYVGDTLFFSPRKEYIDDVLKSLEREEVKIEVEDSVAGFLGVHIERGEQEGTITLTQKGLIRRILDALNINDLPHKFTPTQQSALPADKDGEPPDGTFNYSSVIGMLQYLQGHSRPDITFAVSQCARYMHKPRRSHEQALICIGQYLKLTQDKGLVLRPSSVLNLDCFVDADFAGLWPYEDKQDPSCVKSRTGYAICIANCPIVWASTLQDLIATSTMEAEYIALSKAMKQVLPLRELFQILGKSVGIDDQQLTTFKTTVWEDNNGALTLANMEPGRMTPRSKFYAVCYHWFRSHLVKGLIEVCKINTSEQRADILTKGLKRETFEKVRKLLCGW
jgi:hypothetical protein